VLHEELTRTRDVNVARRLVRARVQAEVNHEGAVILRRDNVVSAILPRKVLAEERLREVLEDGDTVSSDLQGIDRLLRLREYAASALARADDLTAIVGERLSGGTSGSIDSDQGEIQRLLLARLADNLVREAREAVPVAVLVNVRGRDVVRRARTKVDGLNRPLEVGELNAVLRRGNLLRLEAVDADQRESNALDVDIVDLGVNEDVVNVEVRLGDALRLEAGVREENRRLGHRARNVRAVIDSRNRTGSLRNSVRGGLALKEQVARRREENLVLGSEVNLDETLAVRDRNRRDRETRVAREPEEERDPHIKLGLLKLRGLRAINDRTDLTGSDRVELSASSVNVVEVSEGTAVQLNQIRVALNSVLLADQALPAGALVLGDAELLVHHHRDRIVLIERVAVNIELNLLEHALAGVLGVAQEVADSEIIGSSRRVNVGPLRSASGVRVAGKIDIAVLASDDRIVNGIDGEMLNSVRGSGAAKVGLETTKGTITGGDSGKRIVTRGVVVDQAVGDRDIRNTSSRRGGTRGIKTQVHNHVVEEITELRDREGDRVAVLGRTLLGTDTVVLVTDGREGLEVSVDEQNVCAFNVHQSGGRIGVSLLRTGAHNVLYALVQKFGRHDHAIGFSVVCNKLEDSAGRHFVI